MGKGEERAPVDCVIAGCSDGSIKVFNGKTGELLTSWSSHGRKVVALAIDERPRSIHTFAGDQERILDAHADADDEDFELQELEGGVLFSACAEGTLMAWDLAHIGGSERWARDQGKEEEVVEAAGPQYTQEQLEERDARVRQALESLDLLRNRPIINRTLQDNSHSIAFSRQVRTTFRTLAEGEAAISTETFNDLVRKYADVHQLWIEVLLDVDAAGLKEVGEEFFVEWFVKCASQLAGGQQEVAAQLQALLNNKNPSEAPAEEEQAIAI